MLEVSNYEFLASTWLKYGLQLFEILNKNILLQEHYQNLLVSFNFEDLLSFLPLL